jgi:hypothetical protein
MNMLTSYLLTDGDCVDVTFAHVEDERTEDYDGPVLYVKTVGDGEIIDEGFMLVEDARAYYKRLTQRGFKRVR